MIEDTAENLTLEQWRDRALRTEALLADDMLIRQLRDSNEDLLAALEDADRLLSHLMRVVPWGHTCGTDFALLNKVLCHAPVAIAKARGGT